MVDTNKHIVLYDDACPMCTFQMKCLSWLDWQAKLNLIPLSDPRAQKANPSLTREDLLEAIHVISTKGITYRGARAIRFIGFSLPLIFPLTLILYLPFVILVAEAIYKCISQNRHLISRLLGCKEACSILPTKKSDTNQ